jgi:hypothetical protein
VSLTRAPAAKVQAARCDATGSAGTGDGHEPASVGGVPLEDPAPPLAEPLLLDPPLLPPLLPEPVPLDVLPPLEEPLPLAPPPSPPPPGLLPELPHDASTHSTTRAFVT